MLLLQALKRLNPKSPLISEIVITISNLIPIRKFISFIQHSSHLMDTLNKLRFNKHYHKSNNNRVNENESVDEKVALENLLLNKSWVALNELGFNKDYHKSCK